MSTPSWTIIAALPPEAQKPFLVQADRKWYGLGGQTAFLSAAMEKHGSSDTPVIEHALTGRLYVSEKHNGKCWGLLAVPNALARGAYDAMNELGAEMPKNSKGQFNAHITVFRPEDIEAIGGPDKLSERGHAFHYTLGNLKSVKPDGWADVSKCWFIEAHSPELKNLRKSYGLTPLPSGDHPFHITVAVRKKGILHPNELSKVGESPGPVTENTEPESSLWDCIKEAASPEELKKLMAPYQEPVPNYSMRLLGKEAPTSLFGTKAPGKQTGEAKSNQDYYSMLNNRLGQVAQNRQALKGMQGSAWERMTRKTSLGDLDNLNDQNAKHLPLEADLLALNDHGQDATGLMSFWGNSSDAEEAAKPLPEPNLGNQLLDQSKSLGERRNWVHKDPFDKNVPKGWKTNSEMLEAPKATIDFLKKEIADRWAKTEPKRLNQVSANAEKRYEPVAAPEKTEAPKTQESGYDYTPVMLGGTALAAGLGTHYLYQQYQDWQAKQKKKTKTAGLYTEGKENGHSLYHCDPDAADPSGHQEKSQAPLTKTADWYEWLRAQLGYNRRDVNWEKHTPGSSSVKFMQYDAAPKELRVTYNSEGSPQYAYDGVHPGVADEIKNSDSPGSSLWDNIRVRGDKKKHRYPYRRLS